MSRSSEVSTWKVGIFCNGIAFMGALIVVSAIGYCNVEVWGCCWLLGIWSKICQYSSWISRDGDLFLGGLEGTCKMILIALPWSRILRVLYSTTVWGDLGSDDLVLSVIPISPPPSRRLQDFPSCKGINCNFLVFWKLYSDHLVLLWISLLATYGATATWRVTIRFIMEMIRGPTDDWDLAFLMISPMKVDHPRVTGPLDFSDLDGGIISFFYSFLLSHSSKIKTFISTWTPTQFCSKEGKGASTLLTPTQVLTFCF